MLFTLKKVIEDISSHILQVKICLARHADPKSSDYVLENNV